MLPAPIVAFQASAAVTSDAAPPVHGPKSESDGSMISCGAGRDTLPAGPPEFRGMAMSAVIVLFALALLRWGLLLAGAALLLRRVDACPACFEGTVRIRRPWLERMLPGLTWRWCPACRWEGPSREKPITP